MKKTLLGICLACALFVPAALAQAEKIDQWSYTPTAGFANILFENGQSGADYGKYGGSRIIGGETAYAEYKYYQSTVQAYPLGSGQLSTGGSGIVAGSFLISNAAGNAEVPRLSGGDILVNVALKNGNTTGNAYGTMRFGYLESAPALEDPYTKSKDVFYVTDKWLENMTKNVVLGDSEYKVSFALQEDGFLQKLQGNALEAVKASLASSEYNDTIYGLVIQQDLGHQFKVLADVAYVGPTSAVPLPAAVWLMGTGLVGLMALRKARNKNA